MPHVRTSATSHLPDDTDGRMERSEALDNKTAIHFCNSFGIHANNTGPDGLLGYECRFQYAIPQELRHCSALIKSALLQSVAEKP